MIDDDIVLYIFICIYFKSWKDNLEKANNLYQEAKMASLSSLENILFTTYDDEEEDYSSQGYLQAPISRRGSRRSSRYSRWETFSFVQSYKYGVYSICYLDWHLKLTDWYTLFS